jgi:hypothetical protein
METWTPPNTGGGFGPNISAKPPGEGWTITGYNTQRVQTNNPKMGSGYKTVNVPIYTRMTAPPPPPPQPAPPPAPAPAPAPITPQTSYTQTIPKLEAEVDKAEKAVPTIPQPNAIDPTIKALEEQVKALTDQLSINSTQQIGQAVEQTTPQIDPELIKAREAIEQLRSQMTIQSEAFQGQTAVQQMEAQRQQEAMAQAMAQQQQAQMMMYQQQQQAQLEAQRMAEERMKAAQGESQRQQELYQQSVTSLQNRLNQETANYRAELQGLNESQRAFQINQTRAAMAPEFQISSAENRQIGGTQPFKIRRPSSFTPAMMGITSGALNANNLNVLNI